MTNRLWFLEHGLSMFVYGLCNLYLPFGLVQFAGGDSVCGQEVKIVTMGALYQQTGNAMQIQGIFLRFALCLFRASGWNANHAVRRERERTRREGGRELFFCRRIPNSNGEYWFKKPNNEIKTFSNWRFIVGFFFGSYCICNKPTPLVRVYQWTTLQVLPMKWSDTSRNWHRNGWCTHQHLWKNYAKNQKKKCTANVEIFAKR